jgi:hypothetical protein
MAMKPKIDTLAQAEKLVRDILAKNFNQKIKASELKGVAKKVADAIPTATKEAA